MHELAREVLVLWWQNVPKVSVFKVAWSLNLLANKSSYLENGAKQKYYNGRLIGNRIWPIKWQQRQWAWMALEVIHRLQAFSNAIRRTFAQHYARFQLTECWRTLCVSGASCMNRETTDKIIVYARNIKSG